MMQLPSLEVARRDEGITAHLNGKERSIQLTPIHTFHSFLSHLTPLKLQCRLASIQSS